MSMHRGQQELSGRKGIVLRARPNLIILPRTEESRPTFVIKDPVSLSYSQLDDRQRFALARMDGQHTLEQIQQEFEKEFRPQRLPLEELEAFASQLIQGGLVETVTGATGRRLYEHQQRQQWRERWQRWLNIFYIKVPLLEPDRLLDRLRLLGQLLFHPLAVAGVFVLALMAVGLIVTHWADFVNRLPTHAEFFTWHNVWYVWLALGLVKVCHELGHGLCCRRVGGHVRETGLALLCFFPTLYCDVTDIWMIPDRRKRLAVSAAGVYVELLIAAVATFLWWGTSPATFLHNLCFSLVLVCSVHTVLINANPLMRYDGYFILSDWTAMPNLAARAGQQLRQTLLHWFGAGELCSGPAEPQRGWLTLYGAASLIYRCVVLGGFLYLIYVFLKEHHLQWLGFSLVLVFALTVVTTPLHATARTLWRLGRLPDMSRRRLWITLGLVAIVTVMVSVVPWPVRVRGLALVQVEPTGRFVVVVPRPGGFLDQLLVRDGQKVRQGDVLAILKNPDLDIANQLNDADQALRYKEQQALALQRATLPSLLAPSVRTYGEIDHELLALVRDKETLKAQRDALILRAAGDGVVMGLPNWEVKGKWLKEGMELCAIGDRGSMRVVVLVEAADRQLVQPGSMAWFLSHGAGPRAWSGQVQGVAQVDAQDIPPQLASRAGGEVATQADPVEKQDRPLQPHYLVAVRLEGDQLPLQPGTLGVVSVEAGSATLWWRARRYLGTTFNWGL